MDRPKMMWLAAVVVALAAACKSGDAANQTGDVDGLRRVMTTLTEGLNEGDGATVIPLLRRLVPDEATVKRVLRDGVPPATATRIVEDARQSLETLGVDFTGIEIEHGSAT